MGSIPQRLFLEHVGCARDFDGDISRNVNEGSSKEENSRTPLNYTA